MPNTRVGIPRRFQSTLERRKAQTHERPQQPRSPLDPPEIEPEGQVDVARGSELADHPVVVDAVHAGNPAILRHAQDRLGHAFEVPPVHEIGLELIENLAEPRHDPRSAA